MSSRSTRNPSHHKWQDFLLSRGWITLILFRWPITHLHWTLVKSAACLHFSEIPKYCVLMWVGFHLWWELIEPLQCYKSCPSVARVFLNYFVSFLPLFSVLFFFETPNYLDSLDWFSDILCFSFAFLCVLLLFLRLCPQFIFCLASSASRGLLSSQVSALRIWLWKSRWCSAFYLGGLACCSAWGHKELDAAERVNWTEYIHWIINLVKKYTSCPKLTLLLSLESIREYSVQQ